LGRDGRPCAAVGIVLGPRVKHPCCIAHRGRAALVVFNLFNDAGSKMHRYAGYAAVAFVVARGVYGVSIVADPPAGTSPRLQAVWGHAREMMSGHPPRVAGHNLLGASMSILLWPLAVSLATTGWISRLDRFWGEDWPVD